MPQCNYQEFPCLTGDYVEFDAICKSELIQTITAEEILNRSQFCTSISLDLIYNDKCDFYSVNDYLSSLKDKVGIYHLWIEREHCQDHDLYLMQCVYVGKGYAWDRVKSHIKEKWPNDERIYISFYECENRIAKYLEQLFLDTYDFYLNKDENTGSESLYTRWNEERTHLGTEIQNMADILSDKYPEFLDSLASDEEL